MSREAFIGEDKGIEGGKDQTLMAAGVLGLLNGPPMRLGPGNLWSETMLIN